MILLENIFVIIERSGLMKEQILKILSSKKMVLSTYLIKVALSNELNQMYPPEESFLEKISLTEY